MLALTAGVQLTSALPTLHLSAAEAGAKTAAPTLLGLIVLCTIPLIGLRRLAVCLLFSAAACDSGSASRRPTQHTDDKSMERKTNPQTNADRRCDEMGTFIAVMCWCVRVCVCVLNISKQLSAFPFSLSLTASGRRVITQADLGFLLCG